MNFKISKFQKRKKKKFEFDFYKKISRKFQNENYFDIFITAKQG